LAAPNDDAERDRRTALGVLALCFALNMLGRGIGDTYTVFLLPLQQEFGWARAQLTSVYSVYLVVGACVAPLVGQVFDRIGPRWVYGAGLAGVASAFLLAASMTHPWQFYVLIGVQIGIGVAMTGMVPASALLARWYRARLSVALGVAFSAVGVGAIVFVPLTQWLVQSYDWRTAYRVLGGALLGMLPLLLALPWRRIAAGHSGYRAERDKHAQGGGSTLRGALRTRIFWGMAAAFFCTAAGMFTVIVQLIAFLIDAGYSPLTAAGAYGALGMLSAASVMSSGFLCERFGYRQTISASFVGSAAGMVLMLGIVARPSVALLGGFVAVFGLCMGLRGPIISTICARRFAGPRVASIYGMLFATNALGAAFGSLMGGVLHDLSGGYVPGIAFALVFIGLASLPFWTVKELREFR